MCIRYLVGIDFGHGETTVSYIDLEDNKKTPNDLEDNEKTPKHFRLQDSSKEDLFKIPSVIFWGPTNDGSFKYSLQGYGPDYYVKIPTVYLSFKEQIKDLNKFSNRKQKDAFVNFIRLVYQRLLFYNRDFLKEDGSNFLLFIASPTKWDANEKAEYKKFVEEAIGREIGWVINESDAAYYQKKKEGLVLVVDYGSSTIDFTLMYNNRKIDIDDCSNQLGAQKVEFEMWSKYRFDPDTKDTPQGYDNVTRLVEKLKSENNMEYLNVVNWMLYLIRGTKEDFYTKEGSLSYCDWRENLLKRFFEIVGKPSCWVMFGNEEDFLGGYMQEVSNSFKKVKNAIEKNEELREMGVDCSNLNLILSGGASRMPWVVKSLSNVFSIPLEKINKQRDKRPEYIVSDGIVKYAYELYLVRRKIAEELLKFNFWLSEQDGMLSELISKVCRKACLKRMENDPEIKNYRSEQFADGTVMDDSPENPFKNYYKSSIKGLVMDIIAPINKSIWNNRFSINAEISKDLEREIRKVLDDRFRDSFSTLFSVASDQINLAGNQNGLVLPPITSDFTIGMDKLKEIADHCMDAKGKWNVNTLYGDGFLQKGSYRKERDSDNRKKIADVYFEYIRQQMFEPYPLDVVKERIFGYAVDTIVEAVEHYLAFNPCGYDLAEEIKRELKIETINVCDSPTTQK